MSIIAWLMLGIIAGWMSSKLVSKRGAGRLGDLLVGVAGAYVGGFLFNLFGGVRGTGFDLWSIIVAAAGAIALLSTYNWLSRSSTTGSRKH